MPKKDHKTYNIQVSVDEAFYNRVKQIEKEKLYSSPADVLRDAFRRQFVEGRSSSGKDKGEGE